MTSLRPVVRSAALAGVLALVAGSAHAEALRGPCRVADAYLGLAGKLDRATANVRQDDELTVLVVGSSSTAGVGATTPEKAYTKRLETELEERLPGVEVEVVARGVGGETALGAEARLDREIAAAKPDLVVWQIGTNDAARRIDLATFQQVTERGLARIARAGVDVALLDPQYVPQDEAAYGPYLGALEALAAKTGAPVVHRYAAMRALAKSGATDMLSADRLHMNDIGHACVGAFLAETLGRKLAPTPAVADVAKRT
ncbi:lysophospholipase L1-like esterase [Methylopila capsulata]|uniref:Lysophospholipase L1-like esterase n=1 Tax=Methylopila capsulata TaxID=61654 RepID=A0A9W6ISK1_9HYPH|nr:SGNH/GDSL hydrolase family protein [Methylopila capsulata]MBM7851739.1 lysophospholipase L1-like esterase [Methylopila capsulata]GLK54799.1 hypothetical protein GCM10008170_08180 [Methylopila capsulata]